MANLNESKQIHFLYKTTNLINQKYYIGIHSTNNLSDGYLGSGKRLRYSIRKYGKHNFKLQILEFAKSRDELIQKEKNIVNEDILNDKMCMNLQYGGGGGFSSEEHRTLFFKRAKELSKINNKKGNDGFLRKMKDSEWRENQIKKQKEGSRKYFDTHNGIWLGKKHKPESIQKMKKSKNSGADNPQFGTHWITNGTENKKQKKQEYLPEGWTLGRTIKNKE